MRYAPEYQEFRTTRKYSDERSVNLQVLLAAYS
jgi:hypothetical protein